MSDHDNFDLITFALLLEKAKGDRSINQYASIIDVSSAHINYTSKASKVTTHTRNHK